MNNSYNNGEDKFHEQRARSKEMNELQKEIKIADMTINIAESAILIMSFITIANLTIKHDFTPKVATIVFALQFISYYVIKDLTKRNIDDSDDKTRKVILNINDLALTVASILAAGNIYQNKVNMFPEMIISFMYASMTMLSSCQLINRNMLDTNENVNEDKNTVVKKK